MKIDYNIQKITPKSFFTTEYLFLYFLFRLYPVFKYICKTTFSLPLRPSYHDLVITFFRHLKEKSANKYFN